jgi:exopolysaccharide biosynthesis polyprenyl glycosylphosphotransferase
VRDACRPEVLEIKAAARGRLRVLALLRRVRAWMVVLPVDAVILLLPALWNPDQWKAYVASTVIFLALMTNGGRYRARLHLSVLDDLPSLVGRLLVAAALVATVIALRHEQDAVVTYLTDVAISLGLVVCGRALTTIAIDRGRRSFVTSHRTVLIGGGRLAADLAELLGQHSRYGLRVVGFVDDGEDCPATAFVPRLGKISDLELVVGNTGADVLLVADGQFSERDVLDAVRTPACVACDLLIVPRLHQFHTQSGLADHIGSIPVMRIRTPSLRGPARMTKRCFDIVVSGGLLLLVLPVLAACALAVRLEGGPGVIFRQDRVGRDGVVFECLKLRSLRPVDDAESATTWSVARDPRLGPVGRFLRRTSLDELPQLWNILRGDMTLVGPRPERPHFVDQFSEQFDRYAHRHRVQAGLTGFAQVSGLRGDTSIAERARYDNYYIENWTLWLDIKIVIRTLAEVVFARGR